ncbi:MAG: exodeoxyribonuclease III [Candidatus Hydrogenedentes bacterium]|nr:exodeoxyribonuclease III [Candidatus Hydrogenedentota bacterium]
MFRLYSWNVNGIRAVSRNGFLSWLDTVQPDILCLQEIKARPDDLESAVLNPRGYGSVWQPAQKKGYSGVATYYRKEPRSVRTLGIPRFDSEGRIQMLEYPTFTLINAYYPNSQPERARLDYKLAFCQAMLKFCNGLRAAGVNVVICGDFNIAHEEIDLARPKDNQNSAGYYIEERKAMSKFLGAGYVDTFRYFRKEPGHYTWWSYRARAREKNIGWRIDYFCVNEELLPRVKQSLILPDVRGSDHCPVMLTVT